MRLLLALTYFSKLSTFFEKEYYLVYIDRFSCFVSGVSFFWLLMRSIWFSNVVSDQQLKKGFPSCFSWWTSSIRSTSKVPKVSGRASVSIPAIREQSPSTNIAHSLVSINETWVKSSIYIRDAPDFWDAYINFDLCYLRCGDPSKTRQHATKSNGCTPNFSRINLRRIKIQKSKNGCWTKLPYWNFEFTFYIVTMGLICKKIKSSYLKMCIPMRVNISWIFPSVKPTAILAIPQRIDPKQQIGFLPHLSISKIQST